MRTTTYSSSQFLPDPVREFAARRCAELVGFVLLLACGALSTALMTWSVQDPSLNHATSAPTRNWLGPAGAISADLVMQLFGLASVVLLVPVASWGWRLMTARRLERMGLRVLLWGLGTIAAAAVFALLPITDRWPLPTGLGGVIGDALLSLPRRFGGESGLPIMFAGLIAAGVALLSVSAASGFGISSPYAPEGESDQEGSEAERKQAEDEDDATGEPGFGLISLGAAIHGLLSVRSAFARALGRQAEAGSSRRSRSEDVEPAVVRGKRVEPVMDTRPGRPVADLDAYDDEEQDDDATPRGAGSTRITAPAAAIKSGKRAGREAQPSLLKSDEYELPPLLLLAEAKKQAVTKISEDALEQNARLLEGVLDDFGVKGEIINVRPGPVVTLYELEPAPGIKSSRVIGLADDIARSMSAISARVAVVQGRNAIGIELPNQRRETVYLRELLASEDFEKNKHRLAIALGKTIGGEPVIVDLARMPHLLVAGTTGSGKSVAINTMILSLLYRLRPDECRLIMVDPKMLELSVYDGIPHLLTPVVLYTGSMAVTCPVNITVPPRSSRAARARSCAS